MKDRIVITLSHHSVLDKRILANVVRFYTMPKNFTSGKVPKGNAAAVRITHGKMTERLRMSHKTLVGALN